MSLSRKYLKFISVSMLFFSLLAGSLNAQSMKQERMSDFFLKSLFQKDWTAFYSVSSPLLLSQADSTQYSGLVDQLEAQMGSYQSRWLASSKQSKEYAVFIWNTNFVKDSLAAQVVVDEKNQVSGIWFRPIEQPYMYPPPPYADQKQFDESRMIFGDETKLPGTLTVPKGDGPFPVVVMVAGSGPNDRDETLEGNKPFRDIAWGLAMQGIATFRYDKRTHVYGEKFDAKTMSVEEEVIVDAIEALKFIAQQDKIDPDQVYLLGHSLGGMMGPEVASRSEVVKGLMMLAAPARDLVTVTISQLQFFLDTEKHSDAEKANLEQQISVAKKILNGTATMRDDFLGLSANYYYKMNTYNQVETARKLDIPIYVAQAEKDYQVPAVEFDIWKEALTGNEKVTFKEYKNTFHLFIEVDEPAGRSNYKVEGHVTKELIDDLAGWIKAQ